MLCSLHVMGLLQSCTGGHRCVAGHRSWQHMLAMDTQSNEVLLRLGSKGTS